MWIIMLEHFLSHFYIFPWTEAKKKKTNRNASPVHPWNSEHTNPSLAYKHYNKRSISLIDSLQPQRNASCYLWATCRLYLHTQRCPTLLRSQCVWTIHLSVYHCVMNTGGSRCRFENSSSVVCVFKKKKEQFLGVFLNLGVRHSVNVLMC